MGKACLPKKFDFKEDDWKGVHLRRAMNLATSTSTRFDVKSWLGGISSSWGALGNGI